MDVRQFQLKYIPEEDRIMMAINTPEKSEFLLLFTRRFTKMATDAFIQLFNYQISIEEQAANDEVLAMQHEALISQTDFTQDYEGQFNEESQAEMTILVTQMQISQEANGDTLLSFLGPEDDERLDINLDDTMLHSLYKIMVDTADVAQWDINFTLRVDPYQPVDRTRLN